MGAVYFYHLTHTPLEVTLPSLLTKSRQAGWRVLVRGQDPGFMEWLDQQLWLGPNDGFLPHGQAGGPHDADQPILLTSGRGNPNGADYLMSVGGAELAPDEVTACTRSCILFDGNTEAALQTARGQWRALTSSGCAAQYWSQEDGAWKKKAEHPAT